MKPSVAPGHGRLVTMRNPEIARAGAIGTVGARDDGRAKTERTMALDCSRAAARKAGRAARMTRNGQNPRKNQAGNYRAFDEKNRQGQAKQENEDRKKVHRL